MSAVLGEEPCLDELLGTLAHELRSPLVTIVSAAQVANECDMEPPARRALAVMERQSRQALGIIDDLFDTCAGPAATCPSAKSRSSSPSLGSACNRCCSNVMRPQAARVRLPRR